MVPPACEVGASTREPLHDAVGEHHEVESDGLPVEPFVIERGTLGQVVQEPPPLEHRGPLTLDRPCPAAHRLRRGMKLLQRLERALGRFAIPNLTLLIIAGQAMLFVAALIQPEILNAVTLDPRKVLAGEFWRLLLFLVVPPTTNALFLFLELYFFYLMGTALEEYWGAFRFNAFIGVGALATLAVAFLLPGAGASTNAFVLTSVFLAFAYVYPTFQILLFFLFPIQVKWLAALTWLGIGVSVILGDTSTRLAAIASVANFLLFFGSSLWTSARQGHRRMVHQRAVIRSPVLHQCVECGRTNVSDPKLDFRYRAGADGSTTCYCVDHLPKR